MRRRDFMALAGCAAALSSVGPLAARAQQPAVPVVGFLSSLSAGATAHLVGPFLDGLKEAGYVDGQNVVIEYAGRKTSTIDCRGLPRVGSPTGGGHRCGWRSRDSLSGQVCDFNDTRCFHSVL